MKLQAPIAVELKIEVTDGKHKSGTVTIGMSHGRYPTEQEFRDRVAKFEAEEMPDGFRLKTKREWIDDLVGKVYDGEDDDWNPVYLSAAIPGGIEWDK